MWGSIGLVQIRDLIESIENDVTRKPETYQDFYLATLKHKTKRGTQKQHHRNNLS